MNRQSILVLILLFSFSSCAQRNPVFFYSPTVVQLKGTLTLQDFSGPPGYGETPATDQKISYPVLTLKRAIDTFPTHSNNPNVDASRKSPPLPAKHNITSIQLIQDATISLRDYNGKQVHVAGQLLPAQTGHHVTDVVLLLDNIELIN